MNLENMLSLGKNKINFSKKTFNCRTIFSNLILQCRMMNLSFSPTISAFNNQKNVFF